jgi:hypothetical protein
LNQLVHSIEKKDPKTIQSESQKDRRKKGQERARKKGQLGKEEISNK